jgi:hypothetical protein
MIDKISVMSEATRKISRGQLSVAMIAGTAVFALLVVGVQYAREATRIDVSLDKMLQISRALEAYAESNKAFPPYANFSDDGKPLLSWRVHVLPYLGQQALYEQFHHDEPWDSEHNKSLVSKMPSVFREPNSELPLNDGRTNYLGVKGNSYIFNGTDKGVAYSEIRDGTANTIMLVQVNDDRATVWTKPHDWEFDPEKPLAGLVPNLHPKVFLVAYIDAHAISIENDIDVEIFKRILTISGDAFYTGDRE